MRVFYTVKANIQIGLYGKTESLAVTAASKILHVHFKQVVSVQLKQGRS